MKIKDFKTSSDYTFKNIECKSVLDRDILKDSGRIEISGYNEYKYISENATFNFNILDKSEATLIENLIKRNFYNISEITIVGRESTFFIQIVFFYAMRRFGEWDILISEEVKESLIKKRRINIKEVDNRQINNNFRLYDGHNECFAYTIGNYEDFDKEGISHSNQRPMENIKSIRIYGRDYSLIVKVCCTEDKEYLLAEKVIFNQKNLPIMELAIGKLNFSSHKAYVAEKIKKMLSGKGGYLDIWNKYAQLEGEFLLKKVREVGVLKFDNERMNIEGGNSVVYLKGDFKEAKKILTKGEYVYISEEVPLYLSQQDMTWQEYRQGLKKIHKPQEGQYAKVVSFSESGKLVLECEDIVGKYISLSIQGDEQQISRREDARKSIEEGQAANPALGLIIDGNLSNEFIKNKQVKRIDPLSSYVKSKIFKNEPTPTQQEAIKIALNTPDIAIIQGPPGTGKTTVITAIIERLNELADKNKVNQGQVLISSFQHDAVRNVIERLSINSLPTIKFGTKGEEDTLEDMVEKWCQNLSIKLREKNPTLKESAEQAELFRLHNFYILSPNNKNALAFLEYAKLVNLEKEINDEIDVLIEEIKIREEESEDKLLRSIRNIRTTQEGFLDDGPNTSDDVLQQIEVIIDENNKDNLFVMNTLREASLIDLNELSDELLRNLEKSKKILLEKCMPQPTYTMSKPKKEIIELYARIRSLLIKPQNEMESILFELYNEAENNPTSIAKAIESYNFVYAATTQQSEGKDIRRAKNVRKGEHPTYDTVIIDEAARVNPGDLLVPLAQAKQRIIIVGDHRQLPHIYDEEIFEELKLGGHIEKENSVKKTLFEYLMENAKRMYEKDNIVRTITLDAQYRMHPLLGKFVSSNFYEPYGEKFDSPLDAKHFEQHLYVKPLVWVEMNHQQGNTRKDGTSKVRDCEAKYIVETVKAHIQSEEGKNLTYGIISFYSAQVKEIQRQLGDLAKKVRVGSVDAFQGMEFDVIFLSIVRTQGNLPNDFKREMFIEDTNENEQKKAIKQQYVEKVGRSTYGFLTSENRLCVALSRQKKVLVVVGNSDIFHKDDWGLIAQKCVPSMKNLYNLCLEEGVVISGNA